MAQFATLEDAQAEILRLNGVVTEVTNERDTLLENNKKLTEDNKRISTLNQKYFNQLSAHYAEKGDPDPEPEPGQVDLEAYAKTLNII